MVIYFDIDKFLEKKDFYACLRDNLNWPWQSTHFILSERCHGCGNTTMALTPAERAKRYRDKLKNNPEKAEEVRTKQLARMKAKRKKVSEMNEEEKIRHRNKWKREKRNQRADKPNKKVPIDTIPKNKASNTSSLKQRRMLRRLNNQIQEKLDKITQLTRQLNTQRKRYYRKQLKSNKMIEKQQKIIDKYKAREEFLEYTMRKTYENCKKRVEKDVLKRIIQNCKAGNKTFVAKLMGLQRTTRAKQKRLRLTCCTEIEEFWLRDDVTRATAGKRECRVREKEKRQIRYTVDTLQNLFKKYKELGGKHGITTLWKYKPFYVIYPNLNSRNTCLCIKHANIDLKYKALQLYGPLKQKSLDEIINDVTCDRQSYSCAANLCSQCKNYKVQYNESNNDEKQNATWWQWERVDHEYVKKEGNESKIVKTKKTVKSLKKTTITELKREFESDIIKFKKHVFVMKHQHNQYQTVINNLQDNEALLICDFSENYECKMREEVQALHFGASKNQVCLHTGAIFYKDCMQSFCTISENTSHRPENIWTHLNPILNEIKETKPNVKILHFYSDGPTSQYRQKGNFHLLNTLPKEMGFEYCTWSFSESGHGKSIADGIGGSVKRTIDKHVAYGADAANASQIYNLVTQCYKTTIFFLVDDSQIENYSEKLQNLKTLTGTLNLHQVITSKDSKTKEIKYRDLSCYCGDVKGQCLCFSPQYHSLINATARQATNLRSVRRNRPVESKNNPTHSKPECSKLKSNLKMNNLPIFNHDDVMESINQHEKSSVAFVKMENDFGPIGRPDLLECDNIPFETKTPSPTIELIDLTQSAENMPLLPLCLEALRDDPIFSSTALENENDDDSIIGDKDRDLNKENEPNEVKKPLKRKSKEKIGNSTCQAKYGRNNTKRVLKCSACESNSVQLAKCIICKLWYCSACSGSQITIDLICDTCLNDY